MMGEAIAIAVVGGLVVILLGDLVRGIPKRVNGQLERVLREIPEEDDRERWREELSRVLLEFEGRPLKQMREGREMIRAAEKLVDIHRADRQMPFSPAHEPAVIEGTPSDGSNEASYFTRAFLAAALANLSYRERRILELRYGLGGEPPWTPESVGRKFNVFPERITQIETQALKKIQMLAEAQKLREDLHG